MNIGVPLEQASKLKFGLPIEIIDRQGKAISRGKISFIAPSADRVNQAILVKAVFNNNDKFIDGSNARARIIWSKTKGIAIPVEAVSRIAGETFVFVATEKEQEDGTKAIVAELRPVELGALQGQSYQVISGLKPGERIITSGILNLADGHPVDPQK